LWIRSLDIEVSLYQLSTLLRSGLTLLSALRLIAEQAERGRLRRVWEQVIIDIENGASLADAIARHACFSRIVVQLVSVGEQTGHLAPVLERAAAALEKKRTLRAGLITTLMYPAIVFLVAMGLAVFMIISVLPKMQVFLRALGKKLPPMTQRLVDLGEWTQMHGLTAVIGVVTLLFALVLVFFWPPGRALIDRAALRLPLLGKKVCFFFSEVLMLICNLLFLQGTWRMHELQVTNVSPVVGISMIWIYGIGYVVSVVMGIINLNVLFRLVSGRITERELVQVVEAEGLADVEKQLQAGRP
jgi:type II secretory pathway component PulF